MIINAETNLDNCNRTKNYLKDKIIIADTGYFTEDNLKYSVNKGIDTYIPDIQFRKRDLNISDQDRFKQKNKTMKYKITDFHYDQEKDQYICPDDKILELLESKAKFHHYEGRRYTCKQKYCSHCKQKEKCLKNSNTKKRNLYIVTKKNNRNYSKEMIEKIDLPESRDIYSQRMGIVEPVFANIRIHKRLDRFTLRGKHKVNNQWLLFCIVHNIGKIMKYGELKTT